MNEGSLGEGLLQGWKTGIRLRHAQQNQERKQQRFDAQQELTALQTEAQRVELQDARAKKRRNEALRRFTAAEQAYEAGESEVAAEQFRDGLDALDMSVEDFSPEYARSLETMQKAMKNPDAVDRKATIDAANRVFRQQTRKGVGQTVERDGKKVTITDKRIDEIAPAPTKDGEGNDVEPGIMARMTVTGETEDGETVSWRAPVTANRSSDPDDPAQSIPMDEIARQVVGKKKLMAGLTQSPEFRNILQVAKTRAGGKAASGEFGTMEIKSGDQIETWITDDQGKPVRRLSTAPRWEGDEDEGFDTTEIKRGNKVETWKVDSEGNLVEKIGTAPRWKDEQGGGSAGGINSSIYNSISDEVDKYYETASDRFGAVFTPSERKQALIDAKAAGQRIYVNSDGAITPAEAAQRGVQQVMEEQPTISQEDARLKAEEEYRRQFGTNYMWQDDPNKKEWVSQRAKELRQQSAGGSSASGSGATGGSGARLRDGDSGSAGGGRQGGTRLSDAGSDRSQGSASPAGEGSRGASGEQVGDGRDTAPDRSSSDDNSSGDGSSQRTEQAVQQAREALSQSESVSEEDAALVRRMLIDRGVSEKKADAIINEYR